MVSRDVVHMIVERTGDAVVKGKRPNTFYAKCGYSALAIPHGRKPPEFTAWSSLTTCQLCRLGLKATG